MSAPRAYRGQKVIRSRTGVPDGCEPPCGFWELNPDPLQEQQMLLTTEPSLQPHRDFKHKYPPPPPTPVLCLEEGQFPGDTWEVGGGVGGGVGWGHTLGDQGKEEWDEEMSEGGTREG